MWENHLRAKEYIQVSKQAMKNHQCDKDGENFPNKN